jgi:hypothetical protein
VSAILKWMIVLTLLIVVAGGSGAYWCYVRSDEMLRVAVLDHLQGLAPDLKFGVEQAKFDFSGRVRLLGVSIQLPGDVEPALYVEEMVVTLDDKEMTDFEKVTIQRLRLVHPQLHLVRHRDGRLNWQGIEWHLDKSKPVPEILIEHGTVVVELQRANSSVRKLKLADLNVTSMPAAARKITAAISTRIEPAGPLSATIDANLDGPPLKIEAKWLRLPVDDDLLDLIGELSPAVQGKLLDARLAMTRMAATQAAATQLRPRTLADSGSRLNTSAVSLKSQLPDVSRAAPMPFGLKCDCDLHCRLNWDGPEAPLQYQVLTELHSGQVSNVLLPFPIYEIHGSIYADPQQVVFRDLRAENGATRLFLNTRVSPNQPPQIKLQVRNVQIDEAVKARLPESMRKLVNSFSLTGICDLDWGSTQPGNQATWEGDIRLTGGYVRHEKFQYPIRDVTGTAKLRGSKIEIEGTGKASGVPINLKGWVLNPGPANECEFVVKASGVPINSVLVDACTPAIQKALTELALEGKHDLHARFFKAAGVGEKYLMSSACRLQDCSCTLKSFPYRISRLQGLIFWDDDLVTFKDLSGEHDSTRLTANGEFQRVPAPGRLDLAIHATNAGFDRALEAALPASLQKVWQEFQPSGWFDVDTNITWIPGQPCQVALPRIKVTNAGMVMKSFAWPIGTIESDMSYEGSRLLIKSFSAQHDDTQLRARGVATFPHGEPWRVRFDELHVDDLIPNSTFRKALPPALQRTFDILNPAGKFSIDTAKQGTVELSGGEPGQPITSAWDIQVLLGGSSLTAGIRIEDIHGRIDLKGSNDGAKTTFSGRLDLDSISVFRQSTGLAYQISRVVGPIHLQDEQFVGGMRSMTMPAVTQQQAAIAERISGDFADGKITLDVTADLRGDPDYRLLVILNRGRLESYAQQYLRGQTNLAGIMNGWLQLWGKGRSEDQIKGRGELQIAPAALYELPLFVQIFRALRLDAGDRTAFDRADVVYNIENSRFNFDTIDLVGNALSLRGRGYIRFDGGMQFDFYSMLARNSIRIPIVHEIAGMLSRGWVGVKVTGSIGAPQTRIVPVPEFDEAMKQFLGSFDQPQSRQQRVLPKLLP